MAQVVPTSEGVEEGMDERYYSVTIESWGGGVGSVPSEAISDFADALEDVGALGPASSLGGIAGGLGATFGVKVDDLGDIESLASATHQAETLFHQALDKAGLGYSEIARLDIVDERYLTLDNDQPPARYAGVTELARLFGVSRQRMSELRTRADFPAPVAELAAGPVWTEASVSRFLAEWDRKPGRPRKITAKTEIIGPFEEETFMNRKRAFDAAARETKEPKENPPQ